MRKLWRKGSRLGKYRLERRLGSGGTSDVWQARDTVEGRRIAVKIIFPEIVAEWGRDAIEAEARLAATLSHARVVGIRNADWIDSHFVLVTELAQRSLDDYAGARRSPAIALAILRDVAEGLAHAHSRGLIHRDVKPANIFIYENRRAKLGDFGTARLAPLGTRMQTGVGTFGFMAPEQAYGRPRFASDVFGLALTGYQLYSGVLPGWPFEWPLAGAERFEKRCPGPVQAVLRRGLELDLKKRFVDGIEFHRSLEQAATRSAAKPKKRASGQRSPRRAAKSKARQTDPFELEASWFRRRFGKALESHFDCHACDGPIAESMNHCPWCGTTENSFGEVTTLPLVCPECERGVRPEWHGCPRCSAGRFEPNGKPIPKERQAERVCRRPGCGTELARFTRYCPKCRLKVERPWKVEGLRGCDRCRWPVAPRWRFCGWCGKRNAAALDVSRSRKRT